MLNFNMTRITALELRQNLKQVLERVQAGEEIVVTYRGGQAVRLVPEQSEKADMAGLEGLLGLTPFAGANEDSDSFDKRYVGHLEEKYGKYTR